MKRFFYIVDKKESKRFRRIFTSRAHLTETDCNESARIATLMVWHDPCYRVRIVETKG